MCKHYLKKILLCKLESICTNYYLLDIALSIQTLKLPAEKVTNEIVRLRYRLNVNNSIQMVLKVHFAKYNHKK